MGYNRLSIVGTAGVPARYGGFETLVEYIIEELSKEFEVTVYCSSVYYHERLTYYKGARLIYIPVSPNGKSSILYDSICLLHSAVKSDVVLVLGVGGAFIFPLIRLFTHARIITNIDGLEWKRDKWKYFAKIFLKSQERNAIRFSHRIIADNEGIKKYIEQTYGIISHLIEYGGSQASKLSLTLEVKKRYCLTDTYAFSVCRIEPENNIHIILKAFALSNNHLVIVGNWQSSKYGMDLKRDYQETPNIVLLDAIYDQTILNQIRSNCELYIHGHAAGGTNPSLVEAMWLGLPIIAWDVDYNRYTTEEQALYFNSVESLNVVLQNLSCEQLLGLSVKLREIAVRKYSWQKIAQTYRNLLNE